MSLDLLGQLFVSQLHLWWIIWPGILLGIVVGFLPGFNAENTLIMLLPLTLAMPVHYAFAFMTSLYCATHLGGGIPAILVRIPGTPGAAATTLDGYPLTQQGRGQFALTLSTPSPLTFSPTTCAGQASSFTSGEVHAAVTVNGRIIPLAMWGLWSVGDVTKHSIR